MDRARKERLERILGAIHDLLPGALAQHPMGIPLQKAAGDGDWWRARDRFVVPRADALDHWEAATLGDPYLFIDLRGDGLVLGLEVDGDRGLARLARLLDSDHAERLERFIDAAARFDDDAEAAAIRYRLRADGRWDEAHVDDRVAATNTLGPGLLEALIAAARAALPEVASDTVPPGPPRARRRVEVRGAAVRLARLQVPEGDTASLRRETKRLVDLWRPAWGLVVPRPKLRKPDLDERLAAAYRRSLRLIAGRLGPAARARLRVEVRELQAGYREAGLRRPRLLEIVSERLGLL